MKEFMKTKEKSKQSNGERKYGRKNDKMARIYSCD